MGIQINGQTDIVTSTTVGGKVIIPSASFPSVDNLNASGIVTASQIQVGTGVTIHQNNGVQVGGNTLHSTGLFLNTLTASAKTAIIAYGADSSFQLTAQNGVSANTSGSEVFRFGSNYSLTGWDSFLQFIRGSGSQTGSLAIYTGNNEKVRVDSSGNTGIGTNNPSNRMHLYSTSDGAELLQLEIGGQPANTQKGSIIWRATQTNGQSAKLAILGSSAVSGWGGELFFSTKPNNGTPNDTVVERVRINASGNVGMGTDNPSAKLDVEDNTSSGYIAEFRQKHPSNLGTILIDSPSNSSGRSVSLEMSRANTLQWAIGQAYNDSNDSFHIATSSLQSGNTGAKLTIKTNGDVGIGTFNPAYKLDVRGDVLTYGLRMATDLASQTDTGNIASSATNISYRAYGGFQSYTASVTCNNTWYTLIPNFNDTSGYIIVTAGDASSKNVQEYMFMTTSPAYGVSNFVQLHSHSAWNTGSFELQVGSSGSNLILQARATSYYSSSNISSIYMKIISNY